MMIDFMRIDGTLHFTLYTLHITLYTDYFILTTNYSLNPLTP